MMMRRLFLHVSVIFPILTSISTTGIPEITSYAKVSRSGTKNANTPINSTEVSSEGRSYHTSPVYVPKEIAKLRYGEAQDFPQNQQYSTLDEEMLAKLDNRKLKKQAEDRFHPPAPFEHIVAHSNRMKYKEPDQNLGPSGAPSGAMPSGPMPSVYSTLPKHVYSDGYDYHSEKPKKDNLPSITIDDYSPSDYNSHDSYPPTQISYSVQQVPSYLERYPDVLDKPDYPGSGHPSFDDSYSHDHYPHEVIYDHPPEHYHHDSTTTTTEEPELNDERVNKRPYSYYYIGKKLWYLPLYFSIYFIIYIAALVLKSVARHKINFPQQLADAAGARHVGGPGWWDLTQTVLDAIDKFRENYGVNQKNIKR